MNAQRMLGLALLVAGMALLLFGWNATDSVTENVSEGLTGRFTDKTTWYLIGGAVLAVVGLGLSAAGGRSSTR